MTTSSTCWATNHSASRHSSLGLVPTFRRSNCYSPSTATSAITTASILLCTSIPAIRYVTCASCRKQSACKNEIIQGLRLLRRRRNYSAHLFAQQRMRRTSQLVGLDFSTGRSISPLPVMASVAKARLIFINFRELRLTRRLNWRNAFSYLRVREAILASLGKLT